MLTGSLGGFGSLRGYEIGLLKRFRSVAYIRALPDLSFLGLTNEDRQDHTPIVLLPL